MVAKVRILIVDDSSVTRHLLTDVLAGDPDLTVVDSAANGRIGIEKVSTAHPDLVILDVEMPEMDGLEALRGIRKVQPRLPVIMFSSLTEQGAAVTLEALALGASDYIAKPSNVGSMEAALQRVREELIPKVKFFCRKLLTAAEQPILISHVVPAREPQQVAAVPAMAVAAPMGLASATAMASGSGFTPRPTLRPALSPLETPSMSPTPALRSATSLLAPTVPSATAAVFAPPPIPAVPRPKSRIDLVAIGLSTGGPNALAELLPQIAARFPVPILIVQHMPPIFTRMLAERLASKSALPVSEASAGEVLTPGHIWIAPGGSHMVVERAGTQVRLQLHQGEPENSCRPAVDVLFRSVAEVYRSNALAVVMTGMGQDGLRGCEAIYKVGGAIVVQDEASSVVWGMPGAVVKAGIADGQVPLSQLAREILSRVQVGR